MSMLKPRSPEQLQNLIDFHKKAIEGCLMCGNSRREIERLQNALDNPQPTQNGIAYPYNKCYVCGLVVRSWQTRAYDPGDGLRHADCAKPQPSTDDGKPRCNPDS